MLYKVASACHSVCVSVCVGWGWWVVGGGWLGGGVRVKWCVG